MRKLTQRFWKLLSTCWWRFIGFFRNQKADYMEICISIFEFEVYSLLEPEASGYYKQKAIKTFRRVGRYHGWC